MSDHSCLNCGAATHSKFCPDCGQKTDTHRITLKHFVYHDVLHGVWHFERGILFTLKQALLRPGKAALEYIEGKRVRYYNVFYLCLLIIAADVLLSHWRDMITGAEEIHEEISPATAFVKTYSKVILFSIIPILSLNAWIFYRRLRLNLVEHMILAGMSLLGMLMMSFIFFVLQLISVYVDGGVVTIASLIMGFLLLVYPFWVYYDATRDRYRFWGYFWRMLLFYFLALSEMFFLLGYAIYVVTDGQNGGLNITF